MPTRGDGFNDMKHLLYRALQMIVIVAALSVVLFGLLSAMPGNPVDMLITSNPRVRPEDVIRLKKLRGLDQPWYVQYVRWMRGYYEPHRPATVESLGLVTVQLDGKNGGSASVDLKTALRDPDAHMSAAEIQALIEKGSPTLWKTIEKDPAVINASQADKQDVILEQLAHHDPDFHAKLMQSLSDEATGKLKISGLFGATVQGTRVEQRFAEAGNFRMWFMITNQSGLQTVASVPVQVLQTPPLKKGAGGFVQSLLDAIPAQIVDDPKTFSVDLAPYVLAGKEMPVRYVLDKESPGKIDATGHYTHEFAKPGQTAIRFSVVDAQNRVTHGAFSVEHGPVPDKTRFNRGFIYVFTGDKSAMGFSSNYKRPVWELLAGTDESSSPVIVAGAAPQTFLEKVQHYLISMFTQSGRVGNTLQLMVPAILLSLLIALPLGVLSAYKQYSWLDYIVNFLAFLGISLPVFWFGIMVMALFAEQLQWFPAGGVQTPGIQEDGLWAVVADRFEHAILPTLVLSIAYIGRWLRYMRASMLEVLPADYIRTARAKGLSEKVVILKHALRNALIPVVTILALSVPALFGGAVLTETVFSWPGIGRLEYDAVMNSDYYVAIVVFLIAAVLVMIGNLLADLLYVVVDPRIRTK